MRKLLMVSDGAQLFRRMGGSIPVAFAGFLFALVLSIAGPNAKAKSPKAAAAGDPNKCTVCHNPHNYHEISIPCDQVDKFLQNHPGDFRGRCNVTPHTNK